ncbi:hypothetical protein [Fluviicola sp.]|uniref:hypothetical protein n=1 Tax=Fluviicola sp. TaxID=1917219 RepID=UPI0031DBE738
MNKFITCFMLLLVVACSTDQTIRKPVATDKLRLTVSAKYAFAMGYGTIFTCKVKSVETGLMEKGTVFKLVTVKRRYEEYLMEHPVCKITFKKIATHVEDNWLTTDGFIDKQKNSWEVVAMK